MQVPAKHGSWATGPRKIFFGVSVRTCRERCEGTDFWRQVVIDYDCQEDVTKVIWRDALSRKKQSKACRLNRWTKQSMAQCKSCHITRNGEASGGRDGHRYKRGSPKLWSEVRFSQRMLKERAKDKEKYKSAGLDGSIE